MKKLFSLLFVTFLGGNAALSFAETQSAANIKSEERPSFLWKASKEGVADSYWFGTMHVGAPGVLELPDHVQEVFDASDAVYTEVKMDSATQLKGIPLMMRNDGSTLKGSLSDEDITLFKSILKRTIGSDSMLMFNQMKTWSASVMITLLPMQVKYSGKPSLDQKLYFDAERAGKIVGGLERVEEQLSCFNGLSDEEELILLQDSLSAMDEEIKAGVFVLDAMVESYVSGDVSTLWEMLEESLLMEGDNSKQNELGEKLLNLVLYERNELMVDRFELLVKANPNRKNFVAVGVAHLLGEKSVIEGLQEAGFKVSRVTE